MITGDGSEGSTHTTAQHALGSQTGHVLSIRQFMIRETYPRTVIGLEIAVLLTHQRFLV